MASSNKTKKKGRLISSNKKKLANKFAKISIYAEKI